MVDTSCCSTGSLSSGLDSTASVKNPTDCSQARSASLAWVSTQPGSGSLVALLCRHFPTTSFV
jgi:hypothetical protein